MPPDVDEMLAMLEGEVLQHLRDRQPSEAASRSSWWEQVATSLLANVYDTNIAIDTRTRCARLAGAVVVDLPSDDRVLGAMASKVRLAHLVAYMSHDPQLRNHLAGVADVEELVTEILEAITAEPARVMQISRNWQSLPVSEIRELRRIKNLLRPCMELAGEIRSASLTSRLSEWSEIPAMLP